MRPVPLQSFPRALALVLVASGLGACAQVAGSAGLEPAASERRVEPVVVAEHAAWTWFNDERAVVVGDDLFVGYVDTSGYSAATVLPLDGGAPVSRRLSSAAQVDDHNNPAFAALPDGRVLAAYALHHVEPHWYWRVADPRGDGVAWSGEQRTDDLGAQVTYSNLFRLDDEGGRLYNFYRGINFNPTLMTSDDGGETWADPQHVILSGEGGTTRPYFKYASDGQGRIDVLYTQGHPRDVDNDVLHVYYEDGAMHRSDGTTIQPLPGGEVGPMPVGGGTLVYSAATSGRGWVWDLEYAADGSPVGVYIASVDGEVGLDLRYRYARWDADASRWREREIAYAGTHLYEPENHYAGGIAVDPADVNTVYVSADVHPGTGDPTERYELYRGTTTDEGEAWAWTPITPGATEDHVRPFVPRGDHHVVLWLRGRYTTYTDYDTEVVALIE